MKGTGLSHMAGFYSGVIPVLGTGIHDFACPKC
jgi:hypothetical protein